jgi:aspartyl-tRNA(Asn)/glutamyl-tRNA(Gln) amidotransferase subunit A
MNRRGGRLLAWSFDHFGPLARSVRDLAVAYDAMQGDDTADASSVPHSVESVASELDKGIDDLRIAIWRGDKDTVASSEALEGVSKLAAVLGAQHEVALPEAARARAAASIMTGCEGSSLHAAALRERTDEFDPLVRDRLLAASLIPSAWYVHANRLRHWFRDQVLDLFRSVDLILMPATPFSAPRIGETTQRIGQHDVQVRRHLGAFAQPVSFLGFPVLTIPVRESALRLPIGVSIIAPPWREVLAFRAAAVAAASGNMRASLATRDTTR